MQDITLAIGRNNWSKITNCQNNYTNLIINCHPKLEPNSIEPVQTCSWKLTIWICQSCIVFSLFYALVHKKIGLFFTKILSNFFCIYVKKNLIMKQHQFVWFCLIIYLVWVIKEAFRPLFGIKSPRNTNNMNI